MFLLSPPSFSRLLISSAFSAVFLVFLVSCLFAPIVFVFFSCIPVLPPSPSPSPSPSSSPPPPPPVSLVFVFFSCFFPGLSFRLSSSVSPLFPVVFPPPVGFLGFRLLFSLLPGLHHRRKITSLSG